jgi:hypothetical protein
MQARTRTLRLFAVALLAGVAVSIPAAHAQRATGSKTLVRTWYVRWPTVDHSRSWVLKFQEPFGVLKSGHIYVGGYSVDLRANFPEATDWIVACAHRGPAFASGTLHAAAGSIYALVVLSSGECAGGPKVAGTLQRVKVSVTYNPY